MLARFLHRSYGMMYGINLWCKRHFTAPGALVVISVMFSGIFGFNVFKTTLYQILALSLSVMTVAFVSSLVPFRLKAKVNRILPDYVTCGGRNFYEIEITNLSQKPLKGLILHEDIADPRPSIESLTTIREPYEYLRNAWDRKTLYFRWKYQILKNAKTNFRFVNLPELPAHETIRIKCRITPRYRGYINFSGVTFAKCDILGLFSRLCSIEKYQKLLVLPEQYGIQSPDLLSSRQYHPGGVSLASSIGNSDEFMSLRPYRPGDPMRNIHWKTFAKTRELVSKEFEDEYYTRHALILDTYFKPDIVNERLQGVSGEAVFEEAVRIASSYIQSMQTHESILDLMFVGNQIYSFSSGRGLAHTDRMMEIMACVEPCERKSISGLLPAVRLNLKKFSGSVCVFLGWQGEHKKIYDMFLQASVPVFIIVLTGDKAKMQEKIFESIGIAQDVKVVQTGEILQELGVK